MRFADSENHGFANHYGSRAKTGFFSNVLPAALTMRFADSENHGFANHYGSRAKTGFSNILSAALTMRFAGAPSGDNARRSPFRSLWRLRRPLRREPGPQRRQRAPQPLLCLWRLRPAALTMPFADSENHGFANHYGSRAKTGFSNILPAALPMRFAGAPSGDNARRSPFRSLWRLRREPGPQRRQRAPQPLLCLWRLRRPLRREPGPQRRQRAPRPLLQSLETAPATAERAGPPAATTRAAAPGAVSGDCAGHCGESRAPSGDNARRSPVCSLWRLRRPLRREPGPQRRQRAPQPLLQSLETAPATALREPGPQRRQRAPQAWRLRRPLRV